MTHALVTVLVPKDGSRTVDDLMAPYDEAITVEPYHQAYDLTWAREIFGLAEDASPDEYVAAAIARWGADGPDVHICNGQPCRTTTYNPLSRWDWWSPLPDRPDRWDEPAQKEPGTFVTWSLILPDEGWMERGRLGMFGTSWDENADWDDLFMQAVARYLATGDYEAVVCDYHI